MIKVNYLNDPHLKEWYCEKILKKIKSVDKSNVSTTNYGKIWNQRLLNEEILHDIICEPLSLLQKRYKWIANYMRCPNMRAKLNQTIISHYIKYSLLDTTLRRELMSRMNVKVCPYCNQQYIYAISFENNENEKIYLGDLDHVLPKSAYELFALSLWNLVPSCKSCNQSFKRTKNVNILSPIEDGFNDDCIFTVDFKSAGAVIGESYDFEVSWKTVPQENNQDKINKIEQNLNLFKLNELYEVHKQEVKAILRRKKLCSTGIYRGINIVPENSENDLLHFWVVGQKSC